MKAQEHTSIVVLSPVRAKIQLDEDLEKFSLDDVKPNVLTQVAKSSEVLKTLASVSDKCCWAFSVSSQRRCSGYMQKGFRVCARHAKQMTANKYKGTAVPNWDSSP